MIHDIKKITRKVSPFQNSGKITIAVPELFPAVNKEIEFDIVNIRVVN